MPPDRAWFIQPTLAEAGMTGAEALPTAPATLMSPGQSPRSTFPRRILCSLPKETTLTPLCSNSIRRDRLLLTPLILAATTTTSAMALLWIPQVNTYVVGTTGSPDFRPRIPCNQKFGCPYQLIGSEIGGTFLRRLMTATRQNREHGRHVQPKVAAPSAFWCRTQW